MRALRILTVSLGVAALAGACDDTPAPESATGQLGLDEAVEAQRRLGVFKGDGIGSCEDSCGGKSISGTCWCDDLCDKYGDCCDDRQAVCAADEPCFVGGCSSQLCSDDPGAVSICDFRPEYACYGQHSSCDRQPSGECGWTATDALAQCLDEVQGGGCQPVLCEMYCEHGFTKDAAGCEICECHQPPTGPSCEDSCGGKSKNGDCYCDDLCAQYGDCCEDRVAVCEGPPDCPLPSMPNPDTFCPNGEIQPNYDASGCIVSYKCVEGEAPCFVGGCSAHLCSDTEGLVSTCEYKMEYACYKQPFAECGRQADGSCGWTANDELLQCITEANSACQPLYCTILCEHGFATDDNGCEVCSCNPPPSACEGHCGGKADEGCWCDDFCATYGDCCPGNEEVCGN